jgi:hypothetical protein
LARPDVPVFLQAAVGHLDLRLPSLGVADSHRDAVSLSDADHGAVLRVCSGRVGAIPEGRLGHQDRMAVAAEKLAGREPRPADAVPGHRDSAWAVFLGLPALVALVGRSAQPRAEAGLCKPDAARSAA